MNYFFVQKYWSYSAKALDAYLTLLTRAPYMLATSSYDIS